MTATNHALTGALIAIVVDQPLLAIPMAFVSHFVLDVLPHYGYDRCGYGEYFQHRLSYVVSALDVFAMITLLWFTWPAAWLIYVAAFVAISPDFAWPYRYFLFERNGRTKPGTGSKFNQWHSKIQWCERPWGILFEVVWFALILSLVLSLA